MAGYLAGWVIQLLGGRPEFAGLAGLAGLTGRGAWLLGFADRTHCHSARFGSNSGSRDLETRQAGRLGKLAGLGWLAC